MVTLSPVLPVVEIEPCIPFWTALGFTLQATVPHEFKMGFALLTCGDATVIYQTTRSLAGDLEGDFPLGTAMLYVLVDDLEAVTPVLEPYRVAPTRHTRYGTREMLVREPGGHVINVAERVEITP